MLEYTEYEVIAFNFTFFKKIFINYLYCVLFKFGFAIFGTTTIIMMDKLTFSLIIFLNEFLIFFKLLHEFYLFFFFSLVWFITLIQLIFKILRKFSVNHSFILNLLGCMHYSCIFEHPFKIIFIKKVNYVFTYIC